MKVLMLTEGGKSVGFGHITRCLSLYQAFEERGITPTLIVNGDNDVEFLLKGTNYRILDWLEETKTVFKLAKNSGIIIDSYLAGISFYENISGLAGNLAYIDDANRLRYPAGTVINGNVYAGILPYPKKDGIKYLLGAEYAPLRKEFWNIPKKKINKKVKDVLITFGGMNHSDLICKMVNHLRGRFGFNFYLGNSNGGKLKAKEMLDLMSKADICICGGGQTIYELARVGVPTIGICFAQNQLLNLNFCAKEGLIEFAGWFSDKDLFPKIIHLTEKLDYENRFRLSKKLNKITDGQGARRIAEEILRRAKN